MSAASSEAPSPVADRSVLRAGPQEIRDYLRIFRERALTIVVIAVAVALTAFVLSIRQTPIYVSRASVVVGTPSHDRTDTPEMATEKGLAAATPVAAIAASRLGSPEPPTTLARGLSLSVPTDTSILVFRYSHRAPREAQRYAQAFAEAFVEYRRQQLSDRTTAQSKAIEDQIDVLDAQRREVLAEDAAATSRRPGASVPSNPPDVLAIDQQIARLRDQLITARSEGVAPGQVVDSASLPATPAQPRTTQNVAVALVMGALLGLGGALLRDRLDDRLRGVSDMEALLSAPVLGVIPPPRRRRPTSRAIGVTAPGSAQENHPKPVHPSLVTLKQDDPVAVEAFQRLGTNVMLAIRRARARSVLITSCLEGESRTVATANLAVVLANMGLRVIVVSADVRTRSLDNLLPGESDAGLTDVLLEKVPLSDALRHTQVDHLQILPAGSRAQLPSALLGSMTMGELIRKLETLAEIVLVDSVPLLSGFSDATMVAPSCDAVLLVTDASRSTRTMILQAHRDLVQIKSPIIGSVLVHDHESPTRLGPTRRPRAGLASRARIGASGRHRA